MNRWDIEVNTTNHRTFYIPIFVSKKFATTLCRKYCNYQRKHGWMFDSQTIPSSKKIATAMEMFGFSEIHKTVWIDESRTTIRVFENAVINPRWIQELELESMYKKYMLDEM